MRLVFNLYYYFRRVRCQWKEKDSLATAVEFCVAGAWSFVKTVCRLRLFLDMPGKGAFVGKHETFCVPILNNNACLRHHLGIATCLGC